MPRDWGQEWPKHVQSVRMSVEEAQCSATFLHEEVQAHHCRLGEFFLLLNCRRTQDSRKGFCFAWKLFIKSVFIYIALNFKIF